MADYLRTSDSKALEILLWLLENRDKDDKVNTTLDFLAAELGITKVTVSRVFQRLYKEGFLTKIRNGQYQLLRV